MPTKNQKATAAKTTRSKATATKAATNDAAKMQLVNTFKTSKSYEAMQALKQRIKDRRKTWREHTHSLSRAVDDFRTEFRLNDKGDDVEGYAVELLKELQETGKYISANVVMGLFMPAPKGATKDQIVQLEKLQFNRVRECISGLSANSKSLKNRAKWNADQIADIICTVSQKMKTAKVNDFESFIASPSLEQLVTYISMPKAEQKQYVAQLGTELKERFDAVGLLKQG